MVTLMSDTAQTVQVKMLRNVRSLELKVGDITGVSSEQADSFVTRGAALMYTEEQRKADEAAEKAASARQSADREEQAARKAAERDAEKAAAAAKRRAERTPKKAGAS